jgi:hypothetical protein
MAATPKSYFGPVVAYIENHRGESFPHKIGAAFTGSDGRMRLLMNTFPVGRNWDGWLNVFPESEDPIKSTKQTAPIGTQQRMLTPQEVQANADAFEKERTKGIARRNERQKQGGRISDMNDDIPF